MQLLLQMNTPDDAAWTADAENRADAGLTQLQLWRAVEGGAMFALFEVHNPAHAKDWLAKASSFGPVTGTFLRTA